jgi:hypothetical protein
VHAAERIKPETQGAHVVDWSAYIDTVPLGLTNPIKSFVVGDDSFNLSRPVAIGMRSNIMYIADADVGVIFKYFLDSGNMIPLREAGDQVLGEVTDIYVRRDHSFYATDTLGKRVLYFSPSGELLQIFSNGPNISRPIAVTLNESNGELMVADEVYSHVVSFNPQGEPLFGMGGRGDEPGKFRIITDMLKTDEGYYISDRIELAVQFLDLQGNYVDHFGERDLVFPTAIARDKYGRMFVADKSDSSIKVFKDKRLISRVGKNGYGKGEFRYISDMKYHNGRLYVVDSLNGRIQVFDVLPESQARLH